MNPRHELGKLACYQATPHPLRTPIIRIVINFRFNDLSDSFQRLHAGQYFPSDRPYGQFIIKYGNWVQFLVYRTYKFTLRETSYNRFIGLMEKLLKNGKVESPDGKILMNVEKGKWDSMIHNSYDSILLSPKGAKIKPSNLFTRKTDFSVFIGGFSEGDFMSPVYKKFNPISIFDDELTIWTVGWEILSSMETLEGIR